MKLKINVYKKVILFLIMLQAAFCFSQEKYNVYFYGVITPSSQENQKNITLDLFSAQIRAFPEIEFIDRRNFGFDTNFSKLSDNAAENIDENSIFELIPASQDLKAGNKSIIIVSKIDKTDDENWQCNIYAKNLYTSKIDTAQKTFESYYKILTESRTLFSNILSASTNQIISTGNTSKKIQTEQITESSMTIEGISGTWAGEEGITKIIIMRSGRGFVIFNNGASMNISISVETTAEHTKMLNIIQATPFNASYYPDIPRQQALDFATTAKPIKWSFSLTGTGSLTGIKETLAINDSGKIEEGKKTVKWEKVN